MVCQKCGYDFCWNWLGHYPNYVHDPGSYWGLRGLIRYSFIFFVILSFNVKFWYILPYIGAIQKWMLYIGFMFVASNLLVIIALLVEFLWGLGAVTIRSDNNKGKTFVKIFFGISAVFLPFIYIWLFIKMCYSELMYSVVLTLMYEVIFLITIFSCWGMCACWISICNKCR